MQRMNPPKQQAKDRVKKSKQIEEKNKIEGVLMSKLIFWGIMMIKYRIKPNSANT